MSAISQKRKAYFVIALVVGLGIGLTNLFAPLHEFFHVMASDGPSHVTGWASASVDVQDFGAMVTAGWYGELVFFSLLALVCIAAGRRFAWITGGFPIGYVIVTWFRGYGSSDFNEGVATCINSYTQFPVAQRAIAIEAYTDRVFAVWSVMGVAFIGITLFVAIRQLRKKRPRAK